MAIVLAGCTGMAGASDDYDSSRVALDRASWEVGFQTGLASPIGNKSTSLIANNSAFLISDPGNLGEDEFFENRLPSPDFNGTSQIVATMQNLLNAGGHVYYRLNPWLALGIEGSVNFQRDELVTQGSAFNSPIYTLAYSSRGEQVVPTVRFGGWIGDFRPYIMGGAGPYFFSQIFTAELLDADDPDHPPITAGQTNNTYFSTLFGAGIDFNFFDQGSIGLAVQYQRVFISYNNLQFLLPQMRFDCHF